jgi:Flp pilus assembly protein TadG
MNMITKLNAKFGQMRDKVRTLVQARDGAAAVEFALIAPLLITLYLGTLEISHGLEVNKKVGRAASTIGDLISQEPNDLTKAVLDPYLNIGKSAIQPYSRTLPTFIATGIDISAAGVGTVRWSRQLTNTTYTKPYAVGAVVADIPTKLKVPSTFLIKVEAQLEYRPITSWTIKAEAGKSYAAINMAEKYYLRARVRDPLPCTDCATP